MNYKISTTKAIKSIELPCKKKMYNSLEEAQEMINYIMETRVARELHAYKCTICGFWHLTSKSK